MLHPDTILLNFMKGHTRPHKATRAAGAIKSKMERKSRRRNILLLLQHHTPHPQPKMLCHCFSCHCFFSCSRAAVSQPQHSLRPYYESVHYAYTPSPSYTPSNFHQLFADELQSRIFFFSVSSSSALCVTSTTSLGCPKMKKP